MWVFTVSEVLKEPIVTEMGSHGCVFIATNNSNVDPCVGWENCICNNCFEATQQQY